MIEILLILFGQNQYIPNKDLFFNEFQVTYFLDSNLYINEIIYNKDNERITDFDEITLIVNEYNHEIFEYEKRLGFAIMEKIKNNYKVKK